MIASLRGTLADRGTRGDVVIEVAGVGYRVAVPVTTDHRLGEVGSDVHLFVHHHIREDTQALYGFVDRAGRDCFEALLGAHGVGPSLALAILSVHGPNDLARVLVDEDIAALCLVPGVGRKTAARLLVELRDRLDLTDLRGAAPSTGSGTATIAGPADDTPEQVVRRALAELGYGADEVRRSLEGLEESEESSLLRAALRRLATGR